MNIRSKQYNVYQKNDRQHGSLLRIEEVGGSNIFLSLDVAIEFCERLEKIDRIYQDFRPLPRAGRLCLEEIVEPESTYQLEFGVMEYRQMLRISQIKPRVTRQNTETITILDIGDFRRQLTLFVDELATNTLEPTIRIDSNGIAKVVRGRRVAVIYCPSRPWPWTRSYPTEPMLFDPLLVGMILFNRDDNRIRNYCEQTYPNLMVDTFVQMDYGANPAANFNGLRVRWIRQGEQFRINDRPGTLALRSDDHWFTA